MAKIRIDAPTVIAQGPTWDEVKWGPYQFPNICMLDDGRLLCRFSIVQDTLEDHGLETAWYISGDVGKTWTALTAEEIPVYKPMFGARLPDGKRICGFTPRPMPISDELHAELTKKARVSSHTTYIGVEDLPEGLFDPHAIYYTTYDPATGESGMIKSRSYNPANVYILSKGAIGVPFAPCIPRVAPDGSIWQPSYNRGRSPYNLGYTGPYYACYYYQSTDGGQNFELKSWIPYTPNIADFPMAYDVEDGFCEPDVTFLPDGSMITLMRTNSYQPCYIARSTDGGNTWDTPRVFDQCGVMPHLLTLGCGVTLASYGRPGVFLRATDDPSGQVWDDPIEIIPAVEKNPVVGYRSCCYTDMIALDDRTAILLYSDFAVPDAEGTRRKSIMARIVHVEE